MKKLEFMQTYRDELMAIQIFKYDDTRYNEIALFKLPSFDYLRLFFNMKPKGYSEYKRILDFTGPIFKEDTPVGIISGEFI